MMNHFLNESLKENVLGLCKRIAGSRQIVAACFYGPWVCGYADEKSDVNVLLILDSFTLLLNTYVRSTDGVNALILTVDQRALKGMWNGGG